MLFDLGPVRQPGHPAHRARAETATRAPHPGALHRCQPGKKTGDEAGVEGIAGTDRIGDLDGERRYVCRLAIGEHDSTVGTALPDLPCPWRAIRCLITPPPRSAST